MFVLFAWLDFFNGMCSLVVHFDPLNFEGGEAHCSNVLSDAPRVARGFILGSSLKCKVAKSEVRLLQERIVAAHPDSTGTTCDVTW